MPELRYPRPYSPGDYEGRLQRATMRRVRGDFGAPAADMRVSGPLARPPAGALVRPRRQPSTPSAAYQHALRQRAAPPPPAAPPFSAWGFVSRGLETTGRGGRREDFLGRLADLFAELLTGRGGGRYVQPEPEPEAIPVELPAGDVSAVPLLPPTWGSPPLYGGSLIEMLRRFGLPPEMRWRG